MNMENKVETPRLNSLKDLYRTYPYQTAIDYVEELAETLERELTEKTNEVERLRELLNRAIEAAEEAIRLADIDYENDKFGKVTWLKQEVAGIEKLARLAPVDLNQHNKENTVSLNDWRELGADEVICEGDEVQPKHYIRDGEWIKAWPFEIGRTPRKNAWARYRTRRPLPVPEEMPLETPLDLDIEGIEEVANHPLEPRVDFYTRRLAAHSAHAIRYLRDEIQKLKK